MTIRVHPSLQADFSARKEFLNHPEQKKWLASLIDSTLLKIDATQDEFLKLFADANEFLFKSVCVPPSYISLAKKNCKNVLICTVVGFPNGYNTTQNKVFETMEALKLGADEIDFVNNLTFVKSNMWDDLKREYVQIVKAAQNKITKLILETSVLTDVEIEKCTTLAVDCGVNIIKTSTGFGSRGASENDIKIIQSTLQKSCGKNAQCVGIKASGGVRSFEDALKMISLGATRVGTSNGVRMVQMVG